MWTLSIFFFSTAVIWLLCRVFFVHVIIYSSQHGNCLWPGAYLDMTATTIVIRYPGQHISGIPNIMNQFSYSAYKRGNSGKKIRQKVRDGQWVNGSHGCDADYMSQETVSTLVYILAFGRFGASVLYKRILSTGSSGTNCIEIRK